MFKRPSVMSSNDSNDSNDTIYKRYDTNGVELVNQAHTAGVIAVIGDIKPDLFWGLARALYHHHGSDSPLALSLVAWGQKHRPEAIEYMEAHVGDVEALRRTLGGLIRAATANAPDDLALWAAEDLEGLKCLSTYAERKPTPEWMTWLDQFWKFRLDRADQLTIERIRMSDALERAAITSCG